MSSETEKLNLNYVILEISEEEISELAKQQKMFDADGFQGS